MSIRFEVRQVDITTLAVDAVVNAANESLLGGGGVDGAIHRAAGPALLAQCREVVARLGGHCPTGSVATTSGARLPARHVIHAVGPVWRDGTQGEPALLHSCYLKALAEADRLGLASIAFPSISTGIYGYPKSLAVQVVRDAMTEFVTHSPETTLTLVIFACFGLEDTLLYLEHFGP